MRSKFRAVFFFFFYVGSGFWRMIFGEKTSHRPEFWSGWGCGRLTAALKGRQAKDLKNPTRRYYAAFSRCRVFLSYSARLRLPKFNSIARTVVYFTIRCTSAICPTRIGPAWNFHKIFPMFADVSNNKSQVFVIHCASHNALTVSTHFFPFCQGFC